MNQLYPTSLVVRVRLRLVKTPMLALLDRASDDGVFLQYSPRSVRDEDAANQRVSNVASADLSSRIEEGDRIIPERDEPTVLDEVA